MTTYQKVVWRHDNPAYPVELYSEVDDAGWESRKVELYADGRADYADHERATGKTMLGEVPMESLEEISAQPEFEATSITPEEFELVWDRTVAQSHD